MNLLPAFAQSAQHSVDDFVNRVFCMDALALLALLPDSSIDMVLCDLPYGVTACAWDSIIPIEPMWEHLKRVVKQRAAIVLTATQPFTSMLVSSNYAMFRYEWIWQKTNSGDFMTAKIMPRKHHENILVFGVKTPNYRPIMERGEPYTDKPRKRSHNVIDSRIPNLGIRNIGERFPSSIQEFSNGNNNTVHPTQKPVALFEYLIKTYTLENEIILDMTCGSGTTAIAARKTGRRFICGDNSPEYVALAQQRLQTTDPYQDSVLPDGTKQLSLFAS
jgi:site-specific DNA-methyltransferase (adenine-specific)